MINNPNLRLFWLNIKILMAWTQVANQIGVEGSCGRSLGLGIKRCSTMLICAFVSLAFIYSFSINSTTIFLWSVSLLPSVRTIQVELTLSQWGIEVLYKIPSGAESGGSSKELALVTSQGKFSSFWSMNGTETVKNNTRGRQIEKDQDKG